MKQSDIWWLVVVAAALLVAVAAIKDYAELRDRVTALETAVTEGRKP